MSQTLVSPSPLDSFRRNWARLWDDPESRSILIGILGMLLVHLLIFFVAPYVLRSNAGPSILRPHSSARQFNIELAPEMFAPPKPKPPPFKFVETNPNAPENIPDKTENFAARNQQVAQEKPTPNGKSDRPALEGQKEIPSTQIVTGELTKPVEQMQAAPAETPPTPVTPSAPKREQNPLTGFEKKEGEDLNGFAANVAKAVPNTSAVPEKIEGAKDVPQNQNATALQPTIDPLHPRSRPQIVKTPQTRPAIFEQNNLGTSNVGVIGISAQFSNYGAYISRMLDTIQLEWEKILTESSIGQVRGTHVVVKFKMNDEGQVTSVVSVDGTASSQGQHTCVSAITNRSPYGAWTDDMKSLLGESQELTIAFYYQ